MWSYIKESILNILGYSDLIKKELEDKKELSNTIDQLQNDIKNISLGNEAKVKFEKTKVIKELVKVIGEFELAIDNYPKLEEKEVKDFEISLNLVYKNFISLLNSHNVEQFDDVGKIFDPERHEIIKMVSVTDKKKNEIIEVWRKGYTLDGKVIIFAKVIVNE